MYTCVHTRLPHPSLLGVWRLRQALSASTSYVYDQLCNLVTTKSLKTKSRIIILASQKIVHYKLLPCTQWSPKKSTHVQ